MIAAAVTQGASSAAGQVFSKVLLAIVLGNFNPDYSKENRRRMRYLQQKYSQAYEGGNGGEDPFAIIEKIDPNSKLLMDPSGTRPANPFPDERAFDDSLVLNFHPIPGHQGRFVASHAMSCIGAIIDYQNIRRRRPWIPGVSSPGKPNDYVNMFLEELKVWLRQQMTLDNVSAEELSKRERYLLKLKNDNYYWCFPPESEAKSIHKVIDFVHDKVKNALEITQREEMNKSLQLLFKEMNDHTTNVFEFGKHFLSFLLFSSKKCGTNLSTSALYDGRSIETGKLHFLLEKTTHVVFDTYVKDMAQSQQRIYGSQRAIGEGMDRKPCDSLDGSKEIVGAPDSRRRADQERRQRSGYDIAIRGFEATALSLAPTLFLIKVEDPKGHQWIVKRAWSDFESLHASIVQDMSVSHSDLMRTFQLPSKKRTLTSLTNQSEYNESLAMLLDEYCLQLTGIICDLSNRSQTTLAKFLDARYILAARHSDKLQYAEQIANMFLPIKRAFQRRALLSNSSASSAKQLATSTASHKEEADDVSDLFVDKELDEMRREWGVEYSQRIFDAYAQLQRIATMLGWTLEINHFFISMFGNTVAFSRLPLRDILLALKDLLCKFLANAQDLYSFACQLNADAKYNWHKNLQMAENELSRIKFHVDRAVGVITTIETDHLDYETQMRRLKDVYARFQPFMDRVGPSLRDIASELGLPAPQYTLSQLQGPITSSAPNMMITAVAADEGPLTTSMAQPLHRESIFSRSGSQTSLGAEEHANPLTSSGGDLLKTRTQFQTDQTPQTSSTAYDDIHTEENSTVCSIS